VPNQPEQRHRRGRNAAGREVNGIEVGALHPQRQSLGAQLLEQQGALVHDCRCVLARIVGRVDPHVVVDSRPCPSGRNLFAKELIAQTARPRTPDTRVIPSRSGVNGFGVA
jgi:hypothetical protein